MTQVYLSLGTNLGDRVRNLQEALVRLEQKGIAVRRSSSYYETAPRELEDQPWFLNIAIAADTDLAPRELLSRILDIEREMGRERVIPKGPRLIDIDILLYGNSVIAEENLVIPHPAMHGRRFVLEPLTEVESEVRDPVTGELFRERLAALGDQVVKKFVI